MPGGTRFPGTEALRRLGIVEPEVFSIEGGRMTPVMIMADRSRSVATEPVEARGYLFVSVPASAGDRGQVELHSRAPGGIIIEFFNYLEPPDLVAADITTGVFLAVEDGASFLADTGVAQIQNVGGLAVRSIGISGASGIGFRGLLVPNSLGTNARATAIYVPAGSFLSIHSRALNARFTAVILWRELPEIQPA